MCEYITAPERPGRILGGKPVVDLEIAEMSQGQAGKVTSVTARDLDSGELVTYEADAVVFAVGINAMQVTKAPLLLSPHKPLPNGGQNLRLDISIADFGKRRPQR